MVLLLLGFVGSVLALRTNDHCAGATEVVNGPNVVSNVDSLLATQDVTNCANYNDVFFWYNATCTGTATFTWAVPFNYLYVAHFFGPMCTAPGISGLGSCSYDDEPFDTTIHTTANTVYRLVAGPYDAETAVFGVAVVCTPTVRPPGDSCETAINVTTGLTTAAGTTLGAGLSIPCLLERDIFFRYEPTCTGRVVITVSSTQDVSVTPFVGSCATTQPVASECRDATGSGNDETIDENVRINDPFYFAVGNYAPSPGGPFNLDIVCTPGSPVPAGDKCSEAVAVFDGFTELNITGATRDTQCSDYDVFGRYNATCTGSVTIASSEFYLGRWFGDCATGVELACTSYQLEFGVTEGQAYYFVAGEDTETAGNVTVTCVPSIPVVANDYCTGATTITVPSSTTGTTVNATSEVFPYEPALNLYHATWYRIATCNGPVTVVITDIDGSDYYGAKVYAVATGGTCSNMVNAGQYGDVWGETFTFEAQPGADYLIAIGDAALGYATGTYQFNITCVPAPTPPPSNPTNAPPTNPTTPPPSNPTAPTPKPPSNPTAPTPKPPSNPTAPTPKPPSNPTAPTPKPPTNPTNPTNAPPTTTDAASTLGPMLMISALAPLFL